MPAATNANAIADNELRIEREFEAPVALVFKVWAERDHLMRWWGPEEFVCTHLDMDFREGGAWRACISGPGDRNYWMGGEYREIVNGEKIVFTFAWDQRPDEPGEWTVVTVTFHERDGKTVQTFHQAPFSTVAGRDSHVSGWASCFKDEAGYLETLAREAGQ